MSHEPSQQKPLPQIGVRAKNLSLRPKDALPISDARLHQLITENVSDLLAVVDMDGRRLWNNRAYCKTLGYDEQELKELGMEALVHPEDIAEVQTALAHARSHGAQHTLRYRLRHKDGHWIHLESEPQLVNDAAGRPECMVMVARDVTQRLALEVELLKVRQAEALSDLSEHLAEQINSHLTVILAEMSAAMTTIEEDHPSAEYLRRAIAEAEAFHASVMDIWALSTHKVAEAGPVDLLECLNNAVEQVDAPQVDWQRSEGVCSLIGSAEVLTAAFAELLGNALLAGADQIVVRVESEEIEHFHPLAGGALGEGKHWVVSIRDNGQGMDGAVLTRAFQPCYSSWQRSGMGLPTALAAVREHHGTILLSTRPEGGCKATVYLPMAVDMVDGGQAVAHVKPRILFMDDERFVRDFMTALLRQLGYDVVATQDAETLGREFALAIRQEKPFHLVITDLLVPDGNGGQNALEIVKALDPSVRVVITSGLPDHPVIANYQENGFDGVLPKPFTVESLRKTLAELLPVQKAA